MKYLTCGFFERRRGEWGGGKKISVQKQFFCLANFLERGVTLTTPLVDNVLDILAAHHKENVYVLENFKSESTLPLSF